ncbi:FG-GAP-like repeat-containing protein [Gimesia algae]|uniref:FG-GAP repeat protein n=1 Tax=Gimesia algae TaxID=2527971 RepID=A0A517V6P1_9PLAN|nr:FG-GAP-like repeat-containing protein [Gimesia algae]QDT88666.1 FG-GAP repeat protein [Gimesia algae]
MRSDHFCLFLFLVTLTACGKQEPQAENPTAVALPADSHFQEFHAEIQNFCSHCHLCPAPGVLTKEAWRMQIPREYAHFEQNPSPSLRVPPQSEVIQYFVSQAPETHSLPKQYAHPASGPVRFRKQMIRRTDSKSLPATAHLNWVSDHSPEELLLTDMGSGEVGRIRFDPGQPEYELLAELKHPAHIERVDLNQDQQDDYLIADLGSFGPEDHDRGTVSLLTFNSKTHTWQTQTLQDHLGRVADVKAADFDGDGDLDLIVAEFGWHKTGRLLYLENVSPAKTELKFEQRVLDKRHGASHMLITDWNQDGRLDFVTLFSQEHEIIVAFLNEGNNQFRKETIYQAPDPAYGSSSIALVDLDRDDDLDLLFTNGDTMDSFELRSSHSLQWLENKGEFPFTHHPIAPLTGAYCATHGDFDGDGDIDLAACTMTWDYNQPRNTIVWYEQLSPGQFRAYPLDYSMGQHPVITAGDFDGDGDPDLAVGNFEGRETDQRNKKEWFSIWWNEGLQKPE